MASRRRPCHRGRSSPAIDPALLSGAAVAYPLVGYYAFDRAQKRAWRDGSLGEY